MPPATHASASRPFSDIDELSQNFKIRSSPKSNAVRPSPSLPPRPDRSPLSARTPSSPASIIEVPASSPFQKKDAPRLASRLAPAGTFFRPPPQIPRAAPAKRPQSQSVNLVSDERDTAGSRADTRPATFKTRIANFAYDAPPPAHDLEVRRKMWRIFDVFGEKYPAKRVKQALELCKNDVNDAVEWLENQHDRPDQLSKQQPPKPHDRRLVSKAELREKSAKPKPFSSSLSSATPSTPPKKSKGLVRGLKPRPDLDSPMRTAVRPPSSDDPLVIDLVDNHDEEYRTETTPEPTDDHNRKVLQSLNTSTIKELAAMTGIKETMLEQFVVGRPFRTVSKAQRYSAPQTAGSSKRARVSVGETVVEAVAVFLRAVSAIDKVVAKCEAKAQTVKAVLDTWDLDMFGHCKASGQPTPDFDAPLTPNSLTGSRFSRPPIPQQPRAMDGHCEMKPFQLFGLNWMFLLYTHDIGCILADEMGLGKTCQVISLIAHLVEQFERDGEGQRPWPNLIVVPPSTYNNWLIEFERFAPSLSVIGYRGSQSERADIGYTISEESSAYHVVLATYSQMSSEADIDAMRSIRLQCAIFDEGHKMKNPETNVYKDLSRIHAAWKMLLTGTPVQNNLLEMTSLLNFINLKIFVGCMSQIQYIFSQKVTIRDVSNGAFLYSERVKRARTILEPFILQRRKPQVLSDMPAKINSVVHCEMSEEQARVYAEYEEMFKTESSKRVPVRRGRQNDNNNVWMQLRKAALHPLLFRRHFSDEKVEKMGKILMDKVPQSELHQPDLKHLIQELKNSSDFELHLWCRDYEHLLQRFDIPASAELDSGKVKTLLRLIRQYQANGDRVLVFSKFSRLIELLQEVLALQDIDHRVLQGATNVAERQSLIDEFNNDPSIPVFLLTTGAGGTGINLATANKVVIFDQSDNPQDDIQAENRAHRLGQRREVEVVRLLSSRTIEELVYKACQKKIELADKVTGAAGDLDVEKEVRKMMLDQKMTPP